MVDLTDDLAYSAIADIAPRIEKGELSPVELTRACLDRIANFNGQINAFITLLADSAMDEARQAEREIQARGYRGPLHGIPIAHKDLYYTRGVRTTAGSKVLTDFVPDADATAVARLRAAGTVLLGKLNMHEFAAGGTNNNPHYGATHNPWDLERIPGGSSGGSSAALAAGFCLASTGSDTAGSIRLPSHFCGTTGIKPTYGRVSCTGVVPLSWSLDHAGPMTRTALDAALMLNAMAGYDRSDSASVDRPTEDFTTGINAGVGGLKIGIPRSYFNELLQPDVESAWRSAVQVLTQLGATPVDVDFTQLGDAMRIGSIIVRAESRVFHADWLAARPQDYSAEFLARFDTLKGLVATDFVEAQRGRERIRADLWSALDQADVLVLPTAPMTATPIGSDTVELNGMPATLEQMTRCTYPFNHSGFPALTIPCGFDRNSLPIGLQLAARPWQEALLLRVGHSYQLATDWHQRRAPVTLTSRPGTTPALRGDSRGVVH